MSASKDKGGGEKEKSSASHADSTDARENSDVSDIKSFWDKWKGRSKWWKEKQIKWSQWLNKTTKQFQSNDEKGQ